MLNEVNLIGRLGAEVELKSTTSGKDVANFSIATSKSWTKDGEKQEKTEWHKIVVWDKQATNCSKFLSKGSLVHVKGELTTRSWEDSEGNKRYSTEVIAHSVLFLDKKEAA